MGRHDALPTKSPMSISPYIESIKLYGHAVSPFYPAICRSELVNAVRVCVHSSGPPVDLLYQAELEGGNVPEDNSAQYS